MGGNVFGSALRMASFGESHGEAVGVVIDGLPPRLPVSLDDLRGELARRAPGRARGTSARREPDEPRVLSGVWGGATLGTPVAVVFWNRDARPGDYDGPGFEDRPGHGDATWLAKYGVRDPRGGGRASGRETVARVAAGYFAGLALPRGVSVRAWARAIGPVEHPGPPAGGSVAPPPYHLPDGSREGEVERLLADLGRAGESCGGEVGVVVDGCPPGLGEPVFDKLKADLARALLGIGGCVGCSFGAGRGLARMAGTEASGDREAFGGIEGGVASGRRIRLDAAFKPPSTVGRAAREGRHDPCIVPRAVPVAEAMVRFVLADHWLRHRSIAGAAPAGAPPP